MISVETSDNFDEAIRALKKELPTQGEYLLKILNDTEYAQWLHDRAGFWVMNDKLAQNILGRHLRKLARSSKPPSDENIKEALADAAEAILTEYTRVTGQTDRPGQHMDPPRPEHRGSWASDSVTLVKGFLSQIDNEQPKRFVPEEA